MAKKSKFTLRDGKSTGYAVVYYIDGEGWRVLRRLTKTEAKEAMNTITQWAEAQDVALLHVEDSWQRSVFDGKTL